MNKKEVGEIKRQIKMDNELIDISRMAIYYINKDNKIVSKKNKRYSHTKDMIGGVSSSGFWNQLEEEKLLDIFKKTLGGQIGKGLVEYYFPNSFMAEVDGKYKKLYNFYQDALETESDVDDYINLLIENINHDEAYAICVMYGSYMIPTKDINGDKVDVEEEFGDSYEFIIVSFCNVCDSNLGLYYDKKEKNIKHSETNEKVVGAPFTGFIYPTFNDRMCDVHSVLVYNKKPKEPNISLIENVLGCSFSFDPEQEKEKFNTLITKVITKSDDSNVSVDLSTTTKIYEQIKNVIETNVLETELTTVNSSDLKKILSNCGVSEENLEDFDEIFEQEMGSSKTQLKAVNLIDAKKMDIKSPDISISVKADQTDKIKPTTLDGRKYIMIELDDTVDINGLNVKIK